MRGIKYILLLILAALLFFSCSSIPNNEVYSVMQNSLDRAEELIQEDEVLEGYQLVYPIKSLYEEDPRIEKIDSMLTEDQKKALTPNKWLGFNKSKRAPRKDVGLGRRLFWYIPNRIFDFFDTFTLAQNVGPQLGAAVTFTRFLQFGAYSGKTIGIGFYQKSTLGIQAESSRELSFGPLGLSIVAGARVGLRAARAGAGITLLQRPGKAIYQNYRDFWAIGTKIGIIFAGAEFYLHPIDIADFLIGLTSLDPLNDDWGINKRAKLKYKDKKLLEKLNKKLKKADLRSLTEEYQTL